MKVGVEVRGSVEEGEMGDCISSSGRRGTKSAREESEKITGALLVIPGVIV